MKTRIFSGASFVIIGALAGIAGLAFPGRALAGENEPPMIRVLVANYSQASPTIVAAAEREAGRILDKAGLRASWLECDVRPSIIGAQDPCQTHREVGDIRVRILVKPGRTQPQDSAFGFAIHPALASVYYEYVLHRARSDDAELEVPILLGCVMAHELGHLLLGSNSHSDEGIMLPRWEVNQVRQARMGGLLFTVDQSRRIQVAARARTERQNLASGSPRPK